MLYYRYRPPTEVSFKELLYSELFFSSPEECNDPFDSKTFLEFPNDIEKWKNLLRVAWGRFANFNLSAIIDEVAAYLTSKCPMMFEQAISHDFLAQFFRGNGSDEEIVDNILSKALQATLHLYMPSTRYFVSFSKTNNEPLMWSHYADKHQGFCLVFKAIDGSLQQCGKRRKRSFQLETPLGLAPSMSHAIPDRFIFSDIVYEDEVKMLNAFNCFPEAVAGEIGSEEERLKLFSDMNQHYLQKHLSWSYEQETRLTLNPPIAWLFGGHHDYSVQERLFHFEPTQLVGVVLGARMKPQVKQRILEVVNIRQNWISESADYRKIVFDFVVFQSKLSTDQRAVSILPHKLYGLSQALDPSDHNFEERYSRWREGWGLDFNGNHCTKVRIE